jgi:molybdopterin-containing oxidoreductase family iron-sulfur binding subunit
MPAPPPIADDQLEIVFRPDPTVWDGSYANNGWLQELPKPLTKLTWDNAVLMSIRDADRLKVKDEDVVRVVYRDRSVTGPVRVLAGHPTGSITVYLGHGRERGGRVATGVGFDAYALRTSDAPWFGAGVTVTPTGDRYSLAVTEHHNMISAGTADPTPGSLGDHYSRFNETVGEGPARVDGERGREIVKTATLEEYLGDPLVFQEEHKQEGPTTGGEGEVAAGSERAGETIIPGSSNEGILPKSFEYPGNRWAMSIDTQSCIGCNACVVACQSENNIPVIGKEQVLMNRQMHWIRIDTYFEGIVDDPNTYFMPVPCQQCENAPCEIVCPVGATVHSEEGLNDMAYNRCIGTRYCSNNCPYKVRRFNFLKYSDQSPLAQLRANPNVTLRARGVMEKCTYCVQRIWKARIAAEKEDRPVRDGEIVTACQQTCPTEAIVFGNLNEANSRVLQLKRSNLMYGLLVDLTTKPRTTYLARVTNPNPELNKA